MTYAEFINKLNGGARWDVGVSINRSNALPLDANSVFFSLEDAQSYVAGTLEGRLANAYPGQLLAVVTETATTIHYIDINAEGVMSLKEVGAKVEGDNLAVEITDDGKVTLYGFADAAAATYPRKAADGKIEWVTVQELVEGATENTVTVGDNKSIVTSATTTGYEAKIKGFDDATEGQMMVKGADGIEWQDIPEFDPTDINSAIDGIEGRVAAVEGKVDVEKVSTAIATAKSEATTDAVAQAGTAADAKYVAKEGYVAFTQVEKEKLAGLENYDDSALSDRVTTVEGYESRISTIENDYLKAADKGAIETAYKAADEALDERLIKVEAFLEPKDAEGNPVDIDTALDTLVEIQKYITEDGAAADQMVKDIEANAGNITDLQGEVETIKNDYLKKSDETIYDDAEVRGLISGNTTEIEKINDAETGILKQAKDYADGVVGTENERALQAEQALGGRIDALNTAFGEANHSHTNKTEIDKIQDGDVEKWNNAQANAEATAAAALAQARTEISSEIDTDVSVVNEALESYKGTNDTRVKAVEDSFAALNAKVDVDKVSEAINAAKEAAITAAGQSVDVKLASYDTSTQVDDKIALVNAKFDAYTIKTADSSAFIVNEGKLELNNVAQNKVQGLKRYEYTTVEGEWVATEVESELSEILVPASYDADTNSGVAGLLTPEDKKKLASLVLGDSGVEISGTVNVNNVQGLSAELAKKVDKIFIPGTDAALTGSVVGGVHTVTLPLAAVTAGLAKSNDVENGVVFTEGLGTVKSLNVNKLVQTEGELLVLDGGTAKS